MIGDIINLISTGIDKIFPDAGEKEKNAVNAWLAQLTGQIQVLTTEMTGNWIQRSWRPLLMMVIILIVFNNYVLFGYVNMFLPGKAVALPLDQNLWDLLKIGVGGYVVGRSGEKIVEKLKK